MNLPTRFDRFLRSIGVPTKRNLEAAGGGRRWKDDRSIMRDGASTIAAGGAIISARAQKYVLDNPHGARIVEILTGNLVGTGIVPRPQHPSETVRERLIIDWSSGTDDMDVEGRVDLYGLQARAASDMVIFGEGLFWITANPETGAPQLLRLHPEQLDRSKTLNLSDGGQIVQGVEFAASGRVRAYWIRSRPPGAALASLPLVSTPYPADQIIHMFRPLVPGQVRGLSWFAPVLLTARELDALLDAMIVRAKVAALFVGSITDMDGSGAGFDGTQTGTTLDTTVEPGAVRVEAPGKQLTWSEPPEAGDAPKVATETLRMIAAGVGITYEQLSGDYSQVNYSSARAALLEFRRFIEGIQHHTIVFQFCRPLWRKFVLWEVLRGGVFGTVFRADRAALEAVKWLPPRWDWVDPEKDTKAALLEMRAGLASRSEIVSERGNDIEQLDKEIAADQERADRLGLRLSTDTNSNKDNSNAA